MSENKDYWKQLLGDDFSEDLFQNLLSSEEEKETVEVDQNDPEDAVKPNASPRPAGQKDAASNPDEQEQEKKIVAFSWEDLTEENTAFAAPETMPELKPVYDAELEQELKEKELYGDRDFQVVLPSEVFEEDSRQRYKQEQELRPIRRRREKKTGCLGGVMLFIFVLAVSIVLASLLWLAATDVLALGKEKGTVELTIPRDFTIDEVTDTLYDHGLIKYKFLFKIYAGFSDAEEKIDAGTYQLNTNYDYRALVVGMTQRGGAKVEIEVVIPEGYTLKRIFTLLEANNICFEDDLWTTAANYDFEYDFLSAETLGETKRLEGYLFPDTYIFYMNDRPERVIKKFLDNFDYKLTDEFKAQAEELGYTIREIITVASIVEREAAGDDERANIASVTYNRLNSEDLQYLQMDSTISYVTAETGEPFSLELDSPYNTYKYPGLPIGPIANPGIASIEAALYPAETNYYYFAVGKDKVSHFFKDFDSHHAFVTSDEYISN